MDDQKLTAALLRSAPAPADPTLDDVRRLVGASRAAAQPIKRRRRALAIAAIVTVPLAAVGLTAGIDARLGADFTIPITYVTDEGIPVSCSLFLIDGQVSGRPTIPEIEYLSTRDWSNIGERLYAAALIHEAEVRALPASDPAAPPAGADDATIERMSWSLAVHEIVLQVPAEYSDGGFGTHTDCPGRLH